MMHDLSNVFEEARRKADNWSHQAVREALQRITSLKDDFQADWEEGDEEWGRVLEGDRVVAFVCARVPLVVLHTSIFVDLRQLSEEHGLAVEVVESFDENSYCVSRPLLERVFGKEISGNVSCDSLSICDLWWATV